MNNLIEASQDFRSSQDSSLVGVDSRGHGLTHYVLAERMIQIEYDSITAELHQGVSDALVRMLDTGFRGFHQMSPGELWSAWLEQQTRFWELYDANSLPLDLFEDDPLVE